MKRLKAWTALIVLALVGLAVATDVISPGALMAVSLLALVVWMASPTRRRDKR